MLLVALVCVRHSKAKVEGESERNRKGPPTYTCRYIQLNTPILALLVGVLVEALVDLPSEYLNAV